MKNIPYLLQALIAVIAVSVLTVLNVVPDIFEIAFAATAWLFVGHAFWRQTVGDMRANFDDPDNQRMLTQLSARSGSMLLPMITVILAWPLFAVLAFVMGKIIDTVEGPLVRHEGMGGFSY